MILLWRNYRGIISRQQETTGLDGKATSWIVSLFSTLAIVTIALDRCALGAWRAGGCGWKAVSSRVVSARLQFALVERSAKSSTLICAYAPTYAANRTVKEKFFDDLQSVLYDVPPSDCCIVLCDFNARVGSEQWGGERPDVRVTHGCNKHEYIRS